MPTKQKRLTSGKKSCYDKVGNREQVTGNALTTPYNPNILNQYDSVNANPLSYDLNGNLIAQNGWSYIYDAQNRLIQASNATTLASFNYDARNRCVQRTINGNTTYFYYSKWSLIEERDTNDTLIASYIHGPRKDEILVRRSSANLIYYHHDALGSVSYLTDKNGHLLEKYVYDAFGSPIILNPVNQVLQTSAYTNRFLFTGREYLKEVGLYDYRNRVYSSLLGRFYQIDPVRFLAGDVNLNRYVKNSPAVWTDPEGKWIVPTAIIAAAVIGYGAYSMSHTMRSSFKAGMNWAEIHNNAAKAATDPYNAEKHLEKAQSEMNRFRNESLPELAGEVAKGAAADFMPFTGKEGWDLARDVLYDKLTDELNDLDDDDDEGGTKDGWELEDEEVVPDDNGCCKEVRCHYRRGDQTRIKTVGCDEECPDEP